ncbi:aspartate kinase [Marinilongibacter aquaticus]|uniref:aspartate kinase n=1 Tax=Marinilongibacter aquaticus TaxID=2975157 RepID=UPI0021BDB304|nr:aspartate kinase [Marinilongibacter aquaticus]UBM57436.1 aspartate kinase [Marinilongibacter aquaticus]
MQVWKFGGTSVGKPERMKSIRNLVTADAGKKVVVLSALSGSTNALLSIGESLMRANKEEATLKIDELLAHYEQFVHALFASEEGLKSGKTIVANEFNFIRSLANLNHYNQKHDKQMVAQGEIMSTQLFTAYMKEQGESVALISALDFMRIDVDGEPELAVIAEKLKEVVDKQADKQILVTQGFICRNPRNEIDNLKRGGSDYSASLIGGALEAEEIQIWTDIDGMHNNDPRVVKRTFPVRELLFEEAAELAYFGAKILHPSTITPAKLKGVPVRLKNTMDPEAPGTVITSKISNQVEIKAIAAKDNITAIYIHSMRMLNAYGFLRRVFDVFEKHKTPVDMITTSEVSVAMTIDNSERLDAISADLKQFAELEEHDRNQSIICIVGNFLADKAGIAIRILEAVKHIPIRMISYGASEHNISLLVDSKHKNEALEALNENLFDFDQP